MHILLSAENAEAVGGSVKNIMLAVAGIIAAIVIVISCFFLFKAIRRGRALGMDKKVIKGTILNSAVFSIAPSIPIVVGVAILSTVLMDVLGIPWIRLTVIGALQYEVSAAQLANNGETIATVGQLAAVFVVMTFAILGGPVFNVALFGKYQGKLSDLRVKNKKLLDTISGALLGGMLAAIIAYLIVSGAYSAITGVNAVDSAGNVTIGAVTLLTLLSSVLIMAICGVLMKVFKWKWMENYALPITMIGAMALALLFANIFDKGNAPEAIARIAAMTEVLL